MRLFELLALMPLAVAEDQPSMTEQLMRSVPMFALVGIAFYFVLIRPQQKQRKEQEALLKNVKTGDKVLLNSGIFGIVSNVKEKSLMVKIADNVKIEVLKTAVGSVVQKSAELEAAASSQK